MLIPGILPVSQMGTGANKYKSDCGPACCVCLLHAMEGISLYPDDFYDYMSVPNDSGTSIQQLRTFLNEFEVSTSSFSSAGMETLKKYVNEQRLAIWLIWYKPLTDAGCVQYGGTFYHWVVIVGFDTKFVYINDPYRTDGRSYIPVPISAWNAASCGTGLVCNYSVPGGQDMADTTHRVVASVGGLNVRTGPGIGYATVGKSLLPGEEVIVTSVSENWAKIDGPRLFGYSYYPYLEKLQDSSVGTITVEYKITKPEGIIIEFKEIQ